MIIIQWLINILIFILPFGAIIRINIAPNFHIYPYDLVVSILFISTLIFLYKKHFIKSKLFILNLCFILIGLISLILFLPSLNQQSFINSISYLFRYMFYSSLIFIVPGLSKVFIESIPYKLIISGIVFVIMGFVQFFIFPSLSNLYYLGWDKHLGRLFSTFLDPNFAGTFTGLLFILSAGLLFEKYKKTKRINLFLSFTSFISLLASFLTYSRSTFLMILVAGITFLLIQKYIKLTIIFILFLLITLFFFADLQTEGANPLRTASSIARINSAKEAFVIIQNNPILGVGFNAYRYAQVKYNLRPEVGKSNADSSTDNSYLFVLATTGIVGLFFFLDFWLNILKNTYKYPIAFSSVTGLLINTLFINSIFYAPIMAWIFIYLGFTLSKKRLVLSKFRHWQDFER